MIPRYAPTYTYSDLLRSLSRCFQGNINDNLRSRLARLYKVKHIFLVNSARVALFALLKAYNRPGGVLMPAYNCIVVPEAVQYAGYYPVFADIDYSSLSMTTDAMMKSISSDITVILATHLFGIPCDVDEILRIAQQNEVLIVEDAAPAVGAKFGGQLVGSFSDAAVISFQSTKVISGETGGALLTNDDELAHKVDCVLQAAIAPEDCWRSFAKSVARKVVTSSWVYPATQLGYRILRDERMYEIVAPHTELPSSFLALCSSFSSALVLIQLDRLDWNLSRRRKLSQIYQDELSEHPRLILPFIPENCSPAWIQFPILVDDRRAFYKHMQRNGVDLSWTYRYSCADSFGLDGFPNAQKAAKTVLGLPTYPSLTDEHAQYICNVARKYPAGMH
jgi:dTDP-4-amino-4,6-dideoxygalactose transaminase